MPMIPGGGPAVTDIRQPVCPFCREINGCPQGLRRGRSVKLVMESERDYTGIQRRTDARGAERCRGYVKLNGCKAYGPWGGYDAARAWRLDYLGRYHVGCAVGAKYTAPHRSRGATDARTTELGRMIDEAAADGSCSLDELTVLANQNDPFRLDTEAHRRDADWVRDHLDRLPHVRHGRGLHYAVLGKLHPLKERQTRKQPHRNTESDYQWLCNAIHAARFLGVIPFDRIEDERNAGAERADYTEPNPQSFIAPAELETYWPDDLAPEVVLTGFIAQQKYRLVIVGEKSSLGHVLRPIAREYGADLYLPTGEMSDTRIYELARDAAADGRPCVVFYVSDCDPSGYWMPVVVARKLQALIALEFSGLEIQVRQVGLTPEQVRQYRDSQRPLPAALTDEENSGTRREQFEARHGIACTEVDALMATYPGDLEQLVRDAMAPFFDATLERRVQTTRGDWQRQAATAVDGDYSELESERDRLLAEFDTLNQLLADAGDALEAPDPPELPQAEPPEDADNPLFDSTWDFADATEALIDRDARRCLAT